MTSQSKFNIEQWGPAAWHFMHLVTMTSPSTLSPVEQQQYLNFFESIKHVLPCKLCRTHYAQNLIKQPPKMTTREAMVEWLINVHNEVNKSNNKKQWTVQEVEEEYTSEITTDTTNNDSKVVIVILSCIILVLLICIVVYFISSRAKNQR